MIQFSDLAQNLMLDIQFLSSTSDTSIACTVKIVTKAASLIASNPFSKLVAVLCVDSSCGFYST